MKTRETQSRRSVQRKVQQCWMCAELKLNLPWRIKLYRRKTLYGEYCTKRCANMDAWGPKFRNSHAHYLPNADVRRDDGKGLPTNSESI